MSLGLPLRQALISISLGGLLAIDAWVSLLPVTFATKRASCVRLPNASKIEPQPVPGHISLSLYLSRVIAPFDRPEFSPASLHSCLLASPAPANGTDLSCKDLIPARAGTCGQSGLATMQ